MAGDDALPDELFLVAVDEAGGESVSTLSFSRSTTVLLTFAANRFTRAAARQYQQQFGIGAMDWRMLVMLTRHPGSSVALASKTTGIDKAAVSRSLARLQDKGLAYAQSQASDPRRKDWFLSEAGEALHAEMLAVALQRQKALLDGFDQSEVEQLNHYLRRVLDNLGRLNASSQD